MPGDARLVRGLRDRLGDIPVLAGVPGTATPDRRNFLAPMRV
jgi:hypothetical protein